MAHTDYAALKQRVVRAGLLDKRPRAALVTIGRNLVLLAGAIALLGLVRSWWVVALAAILLSILTGQFGFVMHETGHRQMFRRPWQNQLVGWLHANALLGISYGAWIRQHNAHHANPNHVDLDPDIDIPILAFSPEQALAKRGFARFIVKHQAMLFLPLLTLQATSMQLTALRALIVDPPRQRWLELALIALHWGLYLGLPLYFLGPAATGLIVLIRQSLSGIYLSSVFAPNHKGMPMIDAQTDLDFLRVQVLTARNVRSHPLTDWWYGGLNYQIEHHLFPTVPRSNLRRLQPIVKAFCAEHTIGYYETSVLTSYREILGHLHRMSRIARGTMQPSDAAATT